MLKAKTHEFLQQLSCRRLSRLCKKLGTKLTISYKYAVTSLAVAGAIALWGSSGANLGEALDRLPLVPGVLEIVGIGYTGWFAYKNLVFKPDREALTQKVKDTYKDIIAGAAKEKLEVFQANILQHWLILLGSNQSKNPK